MVDKDKIRKYVGVVLSLMSNNDYKLTNEDNEIINYMKELIKKDPKYSDINDKIINSNGDQNKIDELIDSYTKDDMQNNEKTEEEQISEVFDIPVGDIEHLFLNGGKKIFHFYSESLGRDVVLENTTNGKSLVDVLNDLKNDKDNFDNSQDYLMQETNSNNMEMVMYTPEEILNNRNLVSSLNDSDLNLLGHLVDNADRLNIKLINVENLFYITNDHKIKEISYDMNYKPIVGGPEYEANVENENISQEVTNEDNSDLSDMFSGADDNNDEKEQENENKNEKNKENSGKKMVMTYNNYNENGFASSYFFIFAAIFIIIIFVVIYIVLGELI